MERRHFIQQTAGIAAASAASVLLTREVFADEMPKLASMHPHAVDPKIKALIDSSTDCVKKGDACLQHCIEMLAAADTRYAACAKSVREMTIYCRALADAAMQGSSHLKQLAKITLEVCQSCETECRKHKEHEVCLACAEACVACATQCKAALA